MNNLSKTEMKAMVFDIVRDIEILTQQKNALIGEIRELEIDEQQKALKLEQVNKDDSKTE
jgi:hypothetical protein